MAFIYLISFIALLLLILFGNKITHIQGNAAGHPSKRLLRLFALSPAVHFCSTAHILFFYNPETYDADSGFVRLVSFCMVCCACCLYYVLLSESLFWNPSDMIRRKHIINVSPSLKNRKINHKKLDLFFATAIALLYSLFALHDLGNRNAPSVCYELSYGDSVELRFETSLRVDGTTEGLPAAINYYIAPVSGSEISFSLWEQNVSSDWSYSDEIKMDKVFSWKSVPLSLDPSTDTIWLGLADESASICELVFTDGQGKVLLPANASDYPALFDEQELFPERSTFRDSMYFDEIYHARTAYEFLYGLVTYENTHPPLGKILIMSGIALFGMNPFGWRIAGTLFGIAMVPLMYLFAKRLTKDTPASALACALFSFDFMHFTQSRLATIDVYITFFVILMYFFMYRYAEKCLENLSLKKTFLPLGACGISMGLGIACKWTGVYAGIGLAVIFFGTMLIRYKQSRRDAHRPGEFCREKLCGTFYKTVLFCIVFFIFIPALIYLLSYIPFRTYDTEAGLFARMLENQRTMFDYHSNLDATHPYSSPWYTWPIMKRPIWYYSGIVSDTLREGISAFGNPVVWWFGIPAFFATLFFAAKKKDRTAAFLIIAYLAQYIPWMFVSRITFIYHYFPSVPFVVLMIVYSLLQIREMLRLSDRKYLGLVSVYAALAFGLFLLFYPVLAGEPVDAQFVDRFLRWGKDWVLTAR